MGTAALKITRLRRTNRIILTVISFESQLDFASADGKGTPSEALCSLRFVRLIS